MPRHSRNKIKRLIKKPDSENQRFSDHAPLGINSVEQKNAGGFHHPHPGTDQR
jgi:hypothetical protein